MEVGSPKERENHFHSAIIMHFGLDINRIPHFKINGHLRFRQSHIENWLESKEVRSIVGLQEEIQER